MAHASRHMAGRPEFRFLVKVFHLTKKRNIPPSTLADTHTQRVLDLASQKGLLRASNLNAIEAPRIVLIRLTTAGLLDKVGHGLYACPAIRVRSTKALRPSLRRFRKRCSAC
jgi:hypothetical protein